MKDEQIYKDLSQLYEQQREFETLVVDYANLKQISYENVRNILDELRARTKNEQ